MKIIMLKTERGSLDGLTVKTYELGQEYEFLGSAEWLGRMFVAEGLAKTAAQAQAEKAAAEAVQADLIAEGTIEAPKVAKAARSRRNAALRG